MGLSFKEFVAQKEGQRQERPTESLSLPVRPVLLDEATRATVGRYTARRDKPRIENGEVITHAHVDVPGGYQVSYDNQLKRHHPNKFPSHVPKGAKQAIGQVLDVDWRKLEANVPEGSLKGFAGLFNEHKK